MPKPIDQEEAFRHAAQVARALGWSSDRAPGEVVFLAPDGYEVRGCDSHWYGRNPEKKVLRLDGAAPKHWRRACDAIEAVEALRQGKAWARAMFGTQS